MTKHLIHILFATMMLGVGVTVVDTLTTTDRETLEAFSTALIDDTARTGVATALRYSDPTQVPLDVINAHHKGQRIALGEHNAGDLADVLEEVLRPFYDEDLKLIQESIHIDGDRGMIALRIRNTQGLFNAVFNLERHGDRWLLRKLRVS